MPATQAVVIRGSTQHIATLAGDAPPDTIPEVLARLVAIRDHATDTSLLGEDDGIAAFTKLYHVITATIQQLVTDGKFADPDFLIRLDVEFAARYFSALKAYARDIDATPWCWRVLFDSRSNPRIRAVNFAAAGVNAHINFDLSAALVATWRHVEPDGDGRDTAQYRDYHMINDVFESQMDPLREDLDSVLSQGRDGALWDRLANYFADMIVRFTRDLAWTEAKAVWERRDDADAVRRSEDKLDGIAAIIGERLLRTPILPV